MKTFHCGQRTDDWFELHIARITASYMADVMDVSPVRTLKNGEMRGGESSAKRLAYMGKKIAETLTGEMDMMGYVSPPMIWGNDHEDEARRAYEMVSECMVDQIGFGIHAEIERFGASPDGLIGDDGMLELKCPNTSTHIRWIEEQITPVEHWPQMAAQMAVFGRKWCQFVSYDPRLTRRYQLFIPPRLEADAEDITHVETHVRQFLAEMDAKIERLGELCPEIKAEVPTYSEADGYLPAEYFDNLT